MEDRPQPAVAYIIALLFETSLPDGLTSSLFDISTLPFNGLTWSHCSGLNSAN